MPRSREYLKKRVASRVDEIVPAGDNIAGGTAIEAPIETIDDELDFSAVYVLRTAKLPLVLPAVRGDKKHFHGTSVEDVDTRIIIDSDKKATIVCPDDFLRFVSLRLSGWSRDLKALHDQNDPKYRFQEYNKYTSGSPYKPVGFLVSFLDYTAGEQIKWTIDQTLSANQDLTTLYDGQTPSGGTILATGNIIALTGQTDDDDNGIYLVNVSGSPTKLSHHTSNAYANSGQAIEVYRTGSGSDTIEKFHYIPRLTAEEMPDELIDSMIWHCAGRVFEFMGNTEGSNIAFAKADALLGNLKSGLEGED